MNYLKYIELSAENLQFFLWFRDYKERFNKLPQSEQLLSREWTVEQAEADAVGSTAPRQKKISPEAAAAFAGTDFLKSPQATEAEKLSPFCTPPATPSMETNRDAPSTVETWSESEYPTGKNGYVKKAEGAYDDAGLKWQPFTVQPYREEISRIITIYVADGAPRQLNLSAKERNALLHALENTTHPSAFREVMATVEWSLRCQAHPNFIRWTICNGNRPRVIFARGLGVGGIVGGIVAGIILTLSGAGRAWRVMAFIGFFIGISTLIAAWKGMCVVLHGMHHRHLRPWELFVTDEASELEEKTQSVESLASSNSWEDEPWVAKYEKRNVVRKVFDREVWIKEPALRQIQDTIFVQAIIGAFVISAVSVGIFCALPAGHFF